jgi:hypothetical protein
VDWSNGGSFWHSLALVVRSRKGDCLTIPADRGSAEAVSDNVVWNDFAADKRCNGCDRPTKTGVALRHSRVAKQRTFG